MIRARWGGARHARARTRRNQPTMHSVLPNAFIRSGGGGNVEVSKVRCIEPSRCCRVLYTSEHYLSLMQYSALEQRVCGALEHSSRNGTNLLGATASISPSSASASFTERWIVEMARHSQSANGAGVSTYR